MAEDVDLSKLMVAIRAGDTAARQRLFALTYEELRRRASRQLADVEGHSLNTTALVHEAYLKLGQASSLEVNDRAHFFRIASRAMRQIIVDQARRRLADKRGGGQRTVPIDAVQLGVEPTVEYVVALDDALSRLEKQDERLAQIVQLRFFAGRSVAETAELLGLSERTVKRDWRLARAFLHAELSDPGERL